MLAAGGAIIHCVRSARNCTSIRTNFMNYRSQLLMQGHPCICTVISIGSSAMHIIKNALLKEYMALSPPHAHGGARRHVADHCKSIY